MLEALADVDRLVILGDGLELREAAHRDAIDVAGAFFAAVGAALGPDKPLLVLGGNHDHGLVAGWIDARLQTEPAGFLGLEQRFGRRRRAARRSAWPTPRPPAWVEFAYPARGCATTSTPSTATTPTCTPPCRPSSGSRPG